MPTLLSKAINLTRNMGWRYVGFRAKRELMLRTGLLKSKYPSAPAYRQYLTLEEWKAQPAQFFFESKEALQIPKQPTPQLKETYENIKAGKLLLFNSVLTDLGTDYDWVTNPDSGYRYDINKHWTEIADYSTQAGDIKYVWEKSRFSYLYDIIRYDYHYGEDCDRQVFADILSWIKSNPVNRGPNYRCSQETSLRVMNWTFALHYYKHSPHLTTEVFNQMQYAIYWQLHHVYTNINFSRIAVRNNHAITETLMLYLAGILYPTLPGAATWKAKGKQWLQEEIAYQVYEDGTYLQFSMNYHRVVVQLLTWAIVLSEKNGERLDDVVYDRAKKSVQFLRTCMVQENGWLPNYGANDGALFYKLSSNHYRDYRPQLDALAATMGMDLGLPQQYEDAAWYGIIRNTVTINCKPDDGTHNFMKGGYYVIREPHTLTFIRCGGHKDRPSQADNLHLDIWYKGENILPDAGSYKYNTDAATMCYFSGTQSHNTVMLAGNDQMLRGGHFIWFYWSQCRVSLFSENNDAYYFNGAVAAFKQVKDGITHKRSIIKQKGKPIWLVRDEVIGVPANMPIRQLWHIFPSLKNKITISSKTATGNALQPHIQEGWYSSLYGQKEQTEELSFESTEVVTTIITVADK